MTDTWYSDSSIVSGLGDIGQLSTADVYLDSGVLKLITGEFHGGWTGWYWDGSTWISDSSIITGLTDIGYMNSPTIFNDAGTWKLISGERGNIWTHSGAIFYGWYWNGSTWVVDSSIVNGLFDVGNCSKPTVFLDGSTLKLISGRNAGNFYGWYWNGATWVLDTNIVSGLSDIGRESAPIVFLDGSTLKLISGRYIGTFVGWYWNGSTWVVDSSIVSGLTDVGRSSTPTVFLDGATLKLISGENDGLFNGWSTTLPTYIISGNVQNSNGVNLPSVSIVLQDGINYSANTDNNGDYSQTVDPDVYDVVASIQGNADQSASVDASASDQTQDFIFPITTAPHDKGITLIERYLLRIR